MGEYAEMMLDGTCCASCGDFIDTDNGFATFCHGCAGDFGVEALTGLPITSPRKRRGLPETAKPCVCGTCGKSFKSKGARRQHRRSLHPPASPNPQSDSQQANAVEAGVRQPIQE